MLTDTLDAKVSWPNGVSLQGKVIMNYLADVDPWLVHMTFEVADVQEGLEVERVLLVRGIGKAPKGSWINTPGARFRMGAGDRFLRFRITDQNSGSWADFDVKRRVLEKFLGKTMDLVDYPSEKAALNAYIEKALEEL